MARLYGFQPHDLQKLTYGQFVALTDDAKKLEEAARAK